MGGGGGDSLYSFKVDEGNCKEAQAHRHAIYRPLTSLFTELTELLLFTIMERCTGF